MLRGFEVGGGVSEPALSVQCLDERARLAVAAQLAHPGGFVADRVAHRTQHHLPVAPALDFALPASPAEPSRPQPV